MKDKPHIHLTFEAENLAVPEIHTGTVLEPEPPEAERPAVQYDTVAVPEVHPEKSK